MEIQYISEVHGEATITLTEKELFMIAAALESKYMEERKCIINFAHN